MGHDLSKLIAELYQTAENKQLKALEDILQDKALCKRLVKGAKDTRISFTLQVKRAQKQKPSQPLKPSKCLEPSLHVDDETLASWTKDSSKFWNSSDFKLGQYAHLANHYIGTVHLEQRHDLDVIRCRFRKLFYYELIQLTNPQGTQKTNKVIYQKLSELISSSECIVHDVRTVQENIVGWVRAGRRYSKLSEAFGVGILMVLPCTLSLDYLEKRLPLTNELFKAAIQPFLELKAPAKKFQQLAEIIRKEPIDHFKYLHTGFSPTADISVSPCASRSPDLATLEDNQLSRPEKNRTQFHNNSVITEPTPSQLPSTIPKLLHSANHGTWGQCVGEALSHGRVLDTLQSSGDTLDHREDLIMWDHRLGEALNLNEDLSIAQGFNNHLGHQGNLFMWDDRLGEALDLEGDMGLQSFSNPLSHQGSVLMWDGRLGEALSLDRNLEVLG